MPGAAVAKASTKFPAKMAAGFFLALSLLGIVQAAGLFQQNLLFTSAQTEIIFWGRGSYHPTQKTIKSTKVRLNTLLEESPAHPDYLALQASAAVWLAYWQVQDNVGANAASGSNNQPTAPAVSTPASTPAPIQNYSQQAIDDQYAALLTRPAHRFSWQKLSEYLSRGEATGANIALKARSQQQLSILAAHPGH